MVFTVAMATHLWENGVHSVCQRDSPMKAGWLDRQCREPGTAFSAELEYHFGQVRGLMRFTFNTMVLLPLLRSVPASTAISVVAVLVAVIGLDFGLLRLGRPETAADLVVAWMMAFSVATVVLWCVYMVTNFWTWVTTRWFKRRPSAESAGSTP
jgi:hypothetical protein